jgi:ribonucleoside-diphosphate reductase alpha chain
MKKYGPKLPFANHTHQTKYRVNGETFEEAMRRVASALADDSQHEDDFTDILLNMRFLPGGRVQCAMGAPRDTTPYNCFVSGSIPDSMDGIMLRATQAARTMRRGGGIGYDFSTLRPRGSLITTLDSSASGPVSFMDIFNATCTTISSAGHRRGAQMGVLRVDHPDILEFIHAKCEPGRLTAFNISVAATDEFMRAVVNDAQFELKFDGAVYEVVRARALWNQIMENTWDWAEPGVLFIDQINRMNNLWYCETIAATNPCGEQPLPPYGACLLGSFNLVQYVSLQGGQYVFDLEKLRKDIPVVVRAMDNIVDRALYPLPLHASEARSKRRMGLGVTGVANALEVLGYPYGSMAFRQFLDAILFVLNRDAYKASVDLAREKGPFPLFDAEKFLQSGFMQTMGADIREYVREHGLRNSHLTSIAPTGTISLAADNISSGIEPVFALTSRRRVLMPAGPVDVELPDYAYANFGRKGKIASECTVEDHIGVLLTAARRVDSAVSKTCNVGPDVSFDDFREIYLRAWRGGAKGCTTFRSAGCREGILEDADTGAACAYDPATGLRTCDE